LLFWEDYSIAANLLNRRYVGIDTEQEYLDIAVARKKEIENPQTAELYRSKIIAFTITLNLINIWLKKHQLNMKWV
jgi:DNA modification methylase